MNNQLIRFCNYLVVVSVITILTGCSSTRHLEEGQYLLNKSTIKTDHRELHEEMMTILKQKPNRKILGVFRFHLGIYSLANHGRSTRFKRWIKNTIGEAPVILDTLLTKRSSDQLLIYMQNHGYFNAEVIDSIKYRKRHRANVTYYIKSNMPYKVKELHYNIKDARISSIILSDSANCIIKPGSNYDISTFQKERERLSNLLKNQGYYFFNPLFITYTADSSLQAHLAIIYINIANPPQKENSLEPELHHTYTVKNIYIQTDYDPLSENPSIAPDTMLYQGYYFLFRSKLIYNPKLLLQYIFIHQGRMYSLSDLEQTYKKLQELSVFRFIIIKFEVVPGTDSLNCFIRLNSLPRQAYQLEGEGTNTGGNLGIAGNLSYRNKNTFRGAELFEFKIKGGIEAQREIADSTQNNKNFTLFNTYEIGPVISLAVPRILFPFAKNYHFNNPQTNFLAAYNFQQRPEYQRTLANLSYSLSFKETNYKRHYFYPAEINFIKVKLQASFKQKLLDLKDPALISSYDDQLISDFRYVFVLNTQELGKLKNYVYFRGTFESAGHFVGLINRQLNNNKQEGQRVDVFNVPFAQYLRPDIDLRFYQLFRGNSQLVYHFAAGLGYAYGNSLVIPFEKSFYAGGANDLRAWRARSLGPGTYTNSEIFEKNGDIKINANLEYRFDIFRKLKGALFTDAGNIWLLKYDDSRPTGQFKFDKFADQIAIGTGIGLRFDFTFFILRFDWGIKLKDPTLPADEQWLIKKFTTKNTVLNFGIGYPF